MGPEHPDRGGQLARRSWGTRRARASPFPQEPTAGVPTAKDRDLVGARWRELPYVGGDGKVPPARGTRSADPIAHRAVACGYRGEHELVSVTLLEHAEVCHEG